MTGVKGCVVFVNIYIHRGVLSGNNNLLNFFLKKVTNYLQVIRKVRTFAPKIELNPTKKHENGSECMVVAQLEIEIVAGYVAIACR